MMKLLELLKGKKTYVVGLLMILLGLLKGEQIDTTLILEGLGLLTLRAGVSKLGNGKVPASTAAPVAMFAAALCFLGAGCATLDPGADAVAVRAEQVTAVAVDTIDAFLHYEFENRDLLAVVNPEVKQVADRIRTEAPPAIRKVRQATALWKQLHSDTAKSNLEKVLAALEAIAAEAEQHLIAK